MPFVSEAHGDPVLAASPDLLDEAIVQLLGPFAREEGLDGRAALEEPGESLQVKEVF
jgi:hypothetical protein